MPSLGADMDSGTVLEWLVHPGDAVHHGDLVAVVKTDKADIEVEIFEDGVVGELLVAEGVEVDVGTPLMTLAAAERAHAPRRPRRPHPRPRPRYPRHAMPRHHRFPRHHRLPHRRRHRPQAPLPSAVRRHVRAASPYARRRAVELGVDLAAVAPSQPGHPISAADVERAASTPATVAEPKAARAEPIDQAAAMRLAIGNLMARSKREIPHYYLEQDIALTHTLAWLAQHNEGVPLEERVLPAALFYKAVALAARDLPALNGFWHDDTFVPGSGVHLGVAIALRQGGLVAPAVRDADQLTLPEIMTRLPRPHRACAGRSPAGLGDDRRDDHRHQPGRPGGADRLRCHLPAPGRARRFRQGGRAGVRRRRRHRRAPRRVGDPFG